MGGLLYTAGDGGLLHFLLLSIVIGGVLAMAAGRAIAKTWRPYLIVPVYMLILAAAVRFLHYALFGEELLNLQYYIVSFVIVVVASAYGYRVARAKQMATQYSWLYRRAGITAFELRG